jgi:competence protein ComEC
MLVNIRENFNKVYENIFSAQDSSVVKAMLLGEKKELDKDIRRMYQLNGIAHILAISGVHIAIIGMSLYRKLRKKTGSYVVAGIVTIAVMILYGIMTGSGSSTERAIIMMAVTLIGNALGRTTDMLTSAGIASVILAAFQPAIVMDTGFQLSFAAVLSIAIIYSVLNELADHIKKSQFIRNINLSGKINVKISNANRNNADKSKDENSNNTFHNTVTLQNILKGIQQSFFISISVSMGTLPIIVYNYYQFPLYSVFLNLLVVPLVSVILCCSIFCGIAGMINIYAGSVCAVPVTVILRFYELLCNICGKLPYYNVNVGHISATMVVIYYGTLMCVLGVIYICILRPENNGSNKEIFNSHGKRKLCERTAIIFSILIILSVGAAVEYILYDKNFKVAFLDVGQGDGILIRTTAGTNIMIDGGSTDNSSVGEYVIAPAIRYYAMAKLDYVIVTHPDQDHISGLTYLLTTENTGITIENMVLPELEDMESFQELIALAQEKNINIIYISAGDELKETGENGCILTCINPWKDTDITEGNDLSTVMKLSCYDVNILFTGDMGEDGEEELINRVEMPDIDCDILKVGHHGSKYGSTTEFLNLVTPDVSIISCGKNNIYGHPAPATLERLAACSSDIYTTPECGALIVDIYPEGVYTIREVNE